MTLYCNKRHYHTSTVKGIAKICLASGVGTMIEILGLLSSASYHLFLACVHIFEVPLMIWFVLERNYKQILRIILTGYFFIMLINGVLEALWNQFGQKGNYIFYLVFACGIVISGVRIWKNYTKMKKGIFAIEISNKGKRVQTEGFYDSGNRLRDPYTGKGIHIVSEQILVNLGVVKKVVDAEGAVEEGQITPVCVPYQSLGNEAGILEVYYVEELIVEGEKGRQFIHKSPLGVTKDNLFEGKNYEMILNEEVF